MWGGKRAVWAGLQNADLRRPAELLERQKGGAREKAMAGRKALHPAGALIQLIALFTLMLAVRAAGGDNFCRDQSKFRPRAAASFCDRLNKKCTAKAGCSPSCESMECGHDIDIICCGGTGLAPRSCPTFVDSTKSCSGEYLCEIVVEEYELFRGKQSEAACSQIPCCQLEDGQCWSRVGPSECFPNRPHESASSGTNVNVPVLVGSVAGGAVLLVLVAVIYTRIRAKRQPQNPILATTAPGSMTTASGELRQQPPQPTHQLRHAASRTPGQLPPQRPTGSYHEEKKTAPGLKREGSSIDASACVVCLAKSATHAVVPCGHRCVCVGCAELIRDCPMCRGSKQSVMRVYL